MKPYLLPTQTLNYIVDYKLRIWATEVKHGSDSQHILKCNVKSISHKVSQNTLLNQYLNLVSVD